MYHHVHSEQEAFQLEPLVGDVVRLWDNEFEWTTLHKNPKQLAPMRQEYDRLAQDVLKELNLGPRQDAYAALEAIIERKKPDQFPHSQQFWDQIHKIPDFVDYEQIARGQNVFYRYAGAALTGLLSDSLLGGFGARRISEVLVRTGSFGVESARRRLLQTTQWILDIMHDPENIKPGNTGFIGTVRVRLLHAHVRKRMMDLCAKDPTYYDVQENGIPINDLHSLVTLTSFSTTLIDHSFPKMYVYLDKRSRDDYIALWRYIAYLIGANPDYFVNADTARALFQSILLAELWPDQSEASHTRTLLHNSISSIANQPPSNMSYDYVCAQVRWLHGSDYCDALGVPSVSLKARLVTAAKVNFFLVMSAIGHLVPGIDERRIRRIKPILYDMVVNSKKVGLGGAVSFELEWLPSLSSIVKRDPTQMEKFNTSSIGLERHYLTALLLVSLLAAGCGAAVIYTCNAAIRYLTRFI